MTRPRPTRRSLIAALALAMAAAPSVADAGNVYGTRRTSPFQFTNWLGVTLHDVSISHLYGPYSETFSLGTVAVGQNVRPGNVSFYTGGTFTAADFWFFSATYTDGNGNPQWVELYFEEFDLHAIDAGVYVSMDVYSGSYSYWSDNNLKIELWSNSNYASSDLDY